MNFQSGTYNISNDDYQSASAMSRSGLMLYSKSPYHYWAEKISQNKMEKIPTAAMEMGTAIHAAILEAEEFDKRYFVYPKCDRRTTAGKREFCMAVDQAAGRTAINDEQMFLINKVKESVFSHPQAKELVINGTNESSIFWEGPHGIKCKCRPDILHENMVVDLKTAAKADFFSFKNDFFKYGYHVQAAMIRDALFINEKKTIDDFVYVVVEKEYPYATAVYTLSRARLLEGYDKFLELLSLHKECEQKINWPSYTIQEI